MKLLSLDFETGISKTIHGSTFREPTNDIYTVIYADHPDRVVVEHNVDGFKRNIPNGVVEKLVGTDYLIGHNIGFDLSYVFNNQDIKDYILRGGQIWDTQVAEYHLTGHQHKFSSLAELQLKYLGQTVKDSRISLLYKKGIGADKILAANDRCPRIYKAYENYCIGDGATPLLIFKEQYFRARKNGTLPIIQLYNSYLLSLVNMSTTGIKIDLVKCEHTLKEFTLKALQYLEEAQNLVKVFWSDKRLPPFNINSPDHKSAVLFGGSIPVKVTKENGLYKNGNIRYSSIIEHVYVEGFKVPSSMSTPLKKDGLYNTSDATMHKISDKTTNYKLKEYCRLQKQAMMYKKVAKTYCKAFIDRNVNSRLYANFNNTLTETGRLSSSEPNLQNVSKKNEFGKVLHSMFIAPPGWKCVQVDFCLVPETKVLTDDFIWKQIGDVEVGETLIGFDEHTRNHDGRRWKPSEVLKKKIIQKECLRITTTEGVITCSKDHMFLATRWGQDTLNWTKASQLNLKSTLTKVMEVWETPENNETGWGAGFLDGEGYLSNSSQVGFGQNADGHNKLCFDKMSNLFDKYLINTENRVSDKKRCHKVRPAGMRTGWQAVGIFQPVRLKQKLKEQYQNTTIRSNKNRKVRILSIEDVGVMDVVAMETSTHTFLAEGLLSHNCQLEIWVLAWLSGDELLIQHLLEGVDLHIMRLGYYNPEYTYDELYKLCKIDKDPHWDKQRSSAKTVSYQMAYGAQPKKVAESTGLPIETVEQIFTKEKETYSKSALLVDKVLHSINNTRRISKSVDMPRTLKTIKNTKNDIELLPIFDKQGNIYYNQQEIRQVGYWSSPTGHKYHFVDSGRATKAGVRRGFSFTQPKNYPMQGGAADIQAATTVELLKKLLEKQDQIQMINEIHDSKWFYIREDVLQSALRWLKDTIENVPKVFAERFGISVPFKFPVDIEIGDNFGEMRKYDE